MKTRVGVLLVLCSLAIPAFGSSIVSVSGDFAISTPTDVSSSPVAPIPYLAVFAEQQNVLVGTTTFDDVVDLHPPGGYTEFTGADMIAGTRPNLKPWDSYFIFCDPDGTVMFPHGSVLFSTQIVGLEVTVDNLNATNAAFGNPSVFYGTFSGLDGLELDGRDKFTISPNKCMLTLNMRSFIPGDRIRVITRSAVPEPATLAVLGVGVVAMLRRRRKA